MIWHEGTDVLRSSPVHSFPLGQAKLTRPPGRDGSTNSPGPHYLQEILPVWNIMGLLRA